MMQTAWLEVTLILLCGIPAVLFCFFYTLYANWWRSPAGRHLFFLTLGVAGLAGVSVVRRLAGEWPGYTATVMGLYLLLAWQLWQRLHLLYRANHIYPEARPRRQNVSEDG